MSAMSKSQKSMSTARRNVRRLMDDYSEQVAQAAIAESSSITASNYLHPIQSRAQAMIAALDSIDAKVKALVSATTRIPGAGKMSAARKQSISDYEESQRLCGRCSAQDQSCGERSTTTVRFYRKVDVRIDLVV